MDYAKEYDRMVEQSNRQQERIKELEAQLAASQARGQVLRELLLKVPEEHMCLPIQQALSIQPDNSAPKALLTAELAAKAARIAELENALEVLRNHVQDEYDRIYISGVLAK